MSNMPEHLKLFGMNNMLVVGITKEEARPLMDEEDFELFVKLYDEDEIRKIRRKASLTTNINFFIDSQSDIFKDRLRHDKIRHMPRY